MKNLKREKAAATNPKLLAVKDAAAELRRWPSPPNFTALFDAIKAAPYEPEESKETLVKNIQGALDNANQATSTNDLIMRMAVAMYHIFRAASHITKPLGDDQVKEIEKPGQEYDSSLPAIYLAEWYDTRSKEPRGGRRGRRKLTKKPTRKSVRKTIRARRR